MQKISRRDFLRRSVAAGMTAATGIGLGGCEPKAKTRTDEGRLTLEGNTFFYDVGETRVSIHMTPGKKLDYVVFQKAERGAFYGMTEKQIIDAYLKDYFKDCDKDGRDDFTGTSKQVYVETARKEYRAGASSEINYHTVAGADPDFPALFVMDRESFTTGNRLELNSQLLGAMTAIAKRRGHPHVVNGLTSVQKTLSGGEPTFKDSDKSKPFFFGGGEEGPRLFVDLTLPKRTAVDYGRVFRDAQVVCFGEHHDESSVKQELAGNMEKFKSFGVTHFGFEFIPPSEQQFLDEYDHTKPEHGKRLLSLIYAGRGNAEEYFKVMNAAAGAGIRLVALARDEPQQENCRLDTQGLPLGGRTFMFSRNALRVFKENPKAKLATLTGGAHAGYNEGDVVDGLIDSRSWVPEMPSFLKGYYGLRATSVMFIGQIPAERSSSWGEDIVETLIRERGFGGKRFMLEVPEKIGPKILSDMEKGWDVVIHLPQTESRQ